MKKLLLLMFAIVAFAACEQAPIKEQSAVRQDAPETITVGFEGDDTRIQLNEAQKTVWTKGDLVSVFYRSNANQQWKYDGETGARTAELKRVDEGNATETMKRVVVVYPYNDNYYINTETYNVQASLPAVQNYLKDSYGTNGNIMISSSEYNQFSLKSVCGWLKLQLTGDGETIKSIKFCGNDGEQVAGELYINSADATAALASDMGDADDNNAGGSLVFEDTILTEVTLDCGEGVALGKEATAFYIALPPQTFENGFTVEIEAMDGHIMTKSTDKTLTIERNHIQPMTAFDFAPSYPLSNEIFYTASEQVTPTNPEAFGTTFISSSWDAETGTGVMLFEDELSYIGDYAFEGNAALLSVLLPNSVTELRNCCFRYCSNLTKAVIPGDIVTFDSASFEQCHSLIAINCKYSTTDLRHVIINNNYLAFAPSDIDRCDIPEGVTHIEAYVLRGSKISYVTIPSSVTIIGEQSFLNCNNLKSVYCMAIIPPIIGDSNYGGIFDKNATGRKIYVPKESITLYRNADKWCEYADDIVGYDFENGEIVEVQPNNEIWYTSSDGNVVTPYKTNVFGANIISNEYNNGKGVIIFDGDVATIGNNAFFSCDSLTSVNIPDSVTEIGYQAFSSCDSLTSVNIPDSVTEIGSHAFSRCTSLTSVNIPDSVTEIGYAAFAECDSLTSVNIPDSVTTIGNKAFQSCTSLTSVNIGDSVTEIGEDAFRNCTSLTSVTIGDSVTTIGDGAFAYCGSLKEFKGKYATEDGRSLIVDNTIIAYANASGTTYTIPDSVTTIGNQAFNNCDSLISVNIHDSVTEIGECAFNSCDSLTSVYCKATTPPALGDTDVFDSNGSDRKVYVPAGSVYAYKSAYPWSEYASAIVGYDFGDSGLVTPEIDDSWKIHYTATSKVTPYDTSAFNVEILSNEWDSTTGEGVITFNGVVETIDSYAFYMCSNLKSVRIPEQVTSIGAGAFRECIKLNDVYLNSEIESIGSGAFTACFDIYNSTYGSINIHLNSIEDWCKISMPVSLVSAQETIYLKINGSTTTDITIPTTIKAIKPYAFRRCAVSSVTLHEEVASIGDKAFYDSWLKNLYCKPTTPPTGGSEMFEETSNLTIYTHRESVDAYKITDGWSEYAYAIVGYDFENVVVVE